MSNINWDRLIQAGAQFLGEQVKEVVREVSAEVNAFSASMTPEPQNTAAQVTVVKQSVSLPSAGALMTLPEIKRCHKLLAYAPHAEISGLCTAGQVRDWLLSNGIAAECEETGP
jgi:hypothetical protein